MTLPFIYIPLNILHAHSLSLFLPKIVSLIFISCKTPSYLYEFQIYSSHCLNLYVLDSFGLESKLHDAEEQGT